MGDIHYRRQLPEGTFLLREFDRECFITRHTWDRLGAYEGTLPTAPSAGRVFRRGDHVIFVMPCVEKPDYVEFHPYKAVICDARAV